MKCQGCGRQPAQVVYFGLPGRLCLNGCNVLTGPASYVPAFVQHLAVGDDGFCFMVYEGSYWPALWHWLKG
jgi:hypothetical protein